MSAFDPDVYRLQSGNLPPELWEQIFAFLDTTLALRCTPVCFEFSKRIPRHVTALGLRVPRDATTRFPDGDRKYKERFSLARFWNLQELRGPLTPGGPSLPPPRTVAPSGRYFIQLL